MKFSDLGLHHSRKGVVWGCMTNAERDAINRWAGAGGGILCYALPDEWYSVSGDSIRKDNAYWPDESNPPPAPPAPPNNVVEAAAELETAREAACSVSVSHPDLLGEVRRDFLWHSAESDSVTNDAAVGRRDSDVPTSGLFDAIDAHCKVGGRMVFWTCPNGCRDIVEWNHAGPKSVATCRKCGASNNALPTKETTP